MDTFKHFTTSTKHIMEFSFDCPDFASLEDLLTFIHNIDGHIVAEDAPFSDVEVTYSRECGGINNTEIFLNIVSMSGENIKTKIGFLSTLSSDIVFYNTNIVLTWVTNE